MHRRDPLPEWFKVKVHSGEEYSGLKRLLREQSLNTVCQGARCPNIWECWNFGTATFMILGDRCTRACTFCGVPGAETPCAPDPDEPRRVAEAVARLQLAWAVLTSVTRDDLPDYGAGHFAACVSEILARRPESGVELLTPDFKGDRAALETVASCGARVIAHNVETVPRLYPEARPEADYRRSLEILAFLAELSAGRYTVKSSLIVGLGESDGELRSVFADLAEAGCTALTIGQYLPPSRSHHPVARYYPPGEFEQLARLAREAGIPGVASGPLVRSSYHAHSLAGSLLHAGTDSASVT
jgi:lipoyl synthase